MEPVAGWRATAWNPRRPVQPRSLYVHVPFCRHRCGYCDFTLVARRDDLVPRYLQALNSELASQCGGTPVAVDTVFLGGGTPTHPGVADLAAMLAIVGRWTQCSPAAEFTIEANPLDLSHEKLDCLVAAGVNRVSLGVQSFDDTVLSTLERDHRQRDLDATLPKCLAVFPNLSLDLIFGVPGQSYASWLETLERAIDSGAAHVSTYGLTFEPGTAFTTRVRRGQLAAISETLEREMYAAAIERLTSAGFRHYELSNFATAGFECRHNEVYWAGGSYFAVGPGAARYVAGRRATNIRSVLGWLARIEQQQSPIADEEELTEAHRARELVYLGLRRDTGVSRRELLEATGCELDSFAEKALSKTTAAGWLHDDGESIRLTPEGRFLANRVMEEFL